MAFVPEAHHHHAERSRKEESSSHRLWDVVLAENRKMLVEHLPDEERKNTGGDRQKRARTLSIAGRCPCSAARHNARPPGSL
jgi:hypothetical protein